MMRATPETMRSMPTTTARAHSVMSGHTAASTPPTTSTTPATMPSTLR